jgi:2OG-Fe(II) oxygenase superfamily
MGGSRGLGDQSAEVVRELEKLEAALPRMRERYLSATPFPHVVLDSFLVPEVAKRAIKEFPPVHPQRWISYLHVNERKFANTEPQTWGPTLQCVAQALNSQRFVRFLSELTGIENLLVDESMEGGGLHQSLAGGFLNIHADFTVHPHRPDWRRRINLLLYLNEAWSPEYAGELEFWSADVKRRETTIAPVGNRVVIFNTDVDAFHGHPERLRCPPGIARQSMAFYYFTVEDNPLVRSTEYRARPGEGPRSVLVYLDKQALRVYDWAKRRLGVSDQAASRLFKGVERIQRRWKQ